VSLFDDISPEHDEPAVERIEKRRRQKRSQDAEDVMFVLGDPRGRRFFMRILRETKLFNVCLANNADLYRHEGARYVGSKLYNTALQHARNNLRLAEREEDERHA